MGAQRALGRTPRSPDELDAVLIGLVERLARRLRAARRVSRTVTIRLRYADFSRATRSHTLPYATAQTSAILATARGLLATAMPTIQRQGLTLLGVALGNLADGRAVQLVLPLDRTRRRARRGAGGRRPQRGLDAALDDIRDRFGSAAVTRAVLLGRDPGVTVPLLPD
jgi:DNA polymerase-4